MQEMAANAWVVVQYNSRSAAAAAVRAQLLPAFS
jgi:hypothetical protein